MNDSGTLITSIGTTGKSTTEEIEWAEIAAVIAYKRDCFAFDLICMAIGGAEKALEITEQTSGWDELVDSAPAYLSGWLTRADWYQKVMLPPFRENRTVIFKRHEV